MVRIDRPTPPPSTRRRSPPGARPGDYRIRWANVRCSNGHRWTTVRMCIAERRFRWFGWWPLRDGDWRDREKDAEADIEHDRALRRPLPAATVVDTGAATVNEAPPPSVDRARWRPKEAEAAPPIPMILYCPACGLQHIDAPDERTPEWTNPPHRSHLCHGCGAIWRPCDIATEGVAAIETRGKADTWPHEASGQAQAFAAATRAASIQRAEEESWTRPGS